MFLSLARTAGPGVLSSTLHNVFGVAGIEEKEVRDANPTSRLRCEAEYAITP
jgi:hypothetical protein